MAALLQEHADPSQAGLQGDTPLHLAGKTNAPDLALRLLKAGADPELRNKQGATFQQYLAMTPIALQRTDIQKLSAIEYLASWKQISRGLSVAH